VLPLFLTPNHNQQNISKRNYKRLNQNIFVSDWDKSISELDQFIQTSFGKADHTAGTL
jgi:hypothetical protein